MASDVYRCRKHKMPYYDTERFKLSWKEAFEFYFKLSPMAF